MPIILDAPSAGVTDFGTSLSFPHTCSGIERALFVVVAAGQNVVGVTYAGLPMTIILGAGTGLVLAGILNPAIGLNNIVVTTAAPDPIAAVSASYNGVDQTTGWENPTQATTGDANPSIDVPSASGALVVGGSAWVDNTGPKSHTPVTPVTERADENGADIQTCAAIGDAPGALTVAFGFTRVGGGFFWNQLIAAVSVLPAAPLVGPELSPAVLDATDVNGQATTALTSDTPLPSPAALLLIELESGGVTLRTTAWPENP